METLIQRLALVYIVQILVQVFVAFPIYPKELLYLVSSHQAFPPKQLW